MYALNGPVENNTAVEVFEGHTDVVKEFVWRKGDYGKYLWLLFIFIVDSMIPGFRRIPVDHLVQRPDVKVLAYRYGCVTGALVTAFLAAMLIGQQSRKLRTYRTRLEASIARGRARTPSHFETRMIAQSMQRRS